MDWDAVAERHSITNGHAARMRYSRLKKQFHGHVPTRRERKSSGVSKRRKSYTKHLKAGPKIEAKLEDEILKTELESPAFQTYENGMTTPISPTHPLLKVESDDDLLPSYNPIEWAPRDQFDHGPAYNFPNSLPRFPLAYGFATPPPQSEITRDSTIPSDESEMEFNKLMSMHEAASSDKVVVKQEPRWGGGYERSL